jgi:CheY-like chemotaxis protein
MKKQTSLSRNRGGVMATILLVEDDSADQKLIKASIQTAGLGTEVRSASNAEEAIDTLRLQLDEDSERGLPDLILLDLNMPGMGGREFLKRIKGDDTLKKIPVVVLTSSQSDRDISDSYRLQAAGYIQKPRNMLELNELMVLLQKYWFFLCKLS